MRKIAFVHNRFPAGGAERVTMDIARYLDSIGGYRVYVFASHPGSFPQEYLTLVKIPSQAIQSRRSHYVEKLIKDYQIDILVEISQSIYDIEGIRRRTGCKVVLACHGEVFWQRYAIMFRRQKKKLLWNLVNRKRYADGTLAMEKARRRTLFDYEHCDAYTVLCQDYKCQLERSLALSEPSHIHVIENPEPVVASPNLDKEKVVMFCGRFEAWSKRIDRLLRIWKQVEDELGDWHLELVGDGPALADMQRLAGELALKRVRFEGKRSNMADYYRRASVVCLTSQTEGWPLALTEGQANGCICVAFVSSAGIVEVLSPSGECGFVVEPFDEGAYADVLRKIAAMSDEESKRLRINGIDKRKQYRPEVISEKWKVLFDSLF